MLIDAMIHDEQLGRHRKDLFGLQQNSSESCNSATHNDINNMVARLPLQGSGFSENQPLHRPEGPLLALENLGPSLIWPNEKYRL